MQEAIDPRAIEQICGGLKKTPKELPSKYLYDDIGSALFDVISLLPEYGLTRAGERLLRRYAEDIVAYLSMPVIVAELGSGSGRKTRWLLKALADRQRTVYCPIEISPAALAQCRIELANLDGVSIVGFEKEYLDGLESVAAHRAGGQQLLVLFLGSTIGNFDRDKGLDFLRRIRSGLLPGDALLLAADLVKPAEQLLPAYDDPLGVTAAFNLNLLARLNREFGADFDLSRFAHQVRWNEQERRIEMHLRSLARQTVRIERAGLEIFFDKDESIWTESSHKYTTEEILGMAESAGFRCDVQWVDQEWPFSQSLFFALP